jgi:hypothetical protein
MILSDSPYTAACTEKAGWVANKEQSDSTIFIILI